MDGWGKVGAALFGGPDIEGAQMQGQTAGADLATKLYNADLKRQQRMKNDRDLAARAKTKQLVAEQYGDLVAEMFDAGIDPRQLSGYRQGMQEVDQGSEIWNMMQGGASMDDLNRALMVAKGDPIQLQRSLGSGTFTPNAYDSRSVPMATDVGQSIISKNSAQAAASHALAKQRNNPAAATTKVPNYTMPPDDLMNQLFGEQADGYNTPMMSPDSRALFEQWRMQNMAADPRLVDGDYAASRYLVEQRKPVTTDISVNGASAMTQTPVTATNPTTGEIIELRNGQWVPVR